MKHIRRLIVGILAGLALVMVMGGAATPAAAATKLFVNDTTANDPSPSYCTSGLSYTTIEAAVAALGTTTSNVTITICRGFYTPPGSLAFDGFTNLKIIGKGGPIISAPSGFVGSLFNITNSNKVTVQGLNISGQGDLGVGTLSVAILFGSTSGTIKGNTISRWHQDFGSAPPYSPTSATYGIVDYAPGLAKKVTIQNNNIYDSQEVGIYVYEGGKAKVTKNRVVYSSALVPAVVNNTGGNAYQVGVIVLYGNGVTVSGNQIQSDADLFPTNTNSRGILLFSTSSSSVVKNTIRGTANQINIESRCDNALFPNANKNKVTGNKLYDSYWNGLTIMANSTGAGCATPHADRNTATGNKIYNSKLNSFTPYGAWVFANGTGVIDRPTIRGNTFAGFIPGNHIVPDGTGVITNPTFTPNKVLVVPPPGPLASPSSADHPEPAPLPAALLNFQ